MACASTPPPQDLVDARHEYDAARNGPAQQYAPAQMHVAAEEMQMAEKACTDDCTSFETRDRAYVALRKIQLAEAEARVAVATQSASMANKQVTLTNAEIQANTANALNNTRQQLQMSQAQIAEANQRAQQAMAELARVAATKEDARGLIITLNGAVLFATNKDTLLGTASQKLDQVASALKDKLKGRSIEVQGYTDSQGSDDYNMGLSQRRADSVRGYLVSQGVPSDKITARGYGKASPVADNTSAEGRADNRRVEIVVHPLETGSASN
jgi:outer membrane protein OmpA-like peptidoglycan-associated protein